MSGRTLFLYAETPIHPGGSESIGAVDLPVQRETTTDLPTIWGSTLKGALRAWASPKGERVVQKVFGSPPPRVGSSGPPEPGWLAVGDARLVAFPAPTLQETFAWVTAPLALARLARLASLAGVGDE